MRTAIVLKPSAIIGFHRSPGPSGRSWLTYLAHTKDNLRSVDCFRCESLILKTHWVMVVMDRLTRRIVGLAVNAGTLDGPVACRMFTDILNRSGTLPNSLSTDNDPLFRFQRWKANLRILEIEEIKSVPDAPASHPFVERLIGTIRREFLDHVPFWTTRDLERKLAGFAHYYNSHRTHRSLAGRPPAHSTKNPASLRSLWWQSHCHGLFHLPATT